MSQKQEVTIRFHTEASRNDGEAFAIPVNLIYQRRQVYLSRVADFSEKQIDRIYPYPAKDGSWGCVFKLNPQGRIRLETMSGEIRGAVIVVFIGTKAGNRQISDMIIDRPVNDGIITVPRGFSEFEILALKKQFKIIGAQDPKNGRDKPRQKPEQFPASSGQQQNRGPSISDPLSTSGTSRRRGGSEPDLPRLSD